jgi:uncharacterized membrane protein YbaN (DUF454 family)
VRKTIWRIAGYGLFGLGLVGIVVPVMPTTVFWILAALGFARSSPAMHRRILTWPGVGATVGLFLQHGAIGRRSKVVALGGILTGAGLLWLTSPGAFVIGAAGVVFAGSALFILTRPSRPCDVIHLVREDENPDAAASRSSGDQSSVA